MVDVVDEGKVVIEVGRTVGQYGRRMSEWGIGDVGVNQFEQKGNGTEENKNKFVPKD